MEGILLKKPQARRRTYLSEARKSLSASSRCDLFKEIPWTKGWLGKWQRGPGLSGRIRLTPPPSLAAEELPGHLLWQDLEVERLEPD